MTRAKKSPPDYWQTTAVFLAGVCLSAITAWFTAPRNVLSKDDLDRLMPAMVAQYSPYTQDQKNIAMQLQALKEVQLRQGDEQIRQGAAMQQVAVDVGRISEKVGVTAHPSSAGPR